MSQPQDVLVTRIQREWDVIRGRILGLIESWGLPQPQERGAKSSFKALSFDAQARITELVTDDALRQALTAVAEGIAELERCDADLALDDDQAGAEYARSFVAQRLDELREQQRDLQHLEGLQRSLGGVR